MIPTRFQRPRNCLLAVCCLVLAGFSAVGAEQSGNYTVHHWVVDGGGGNSTSAAYTNEGSFNDVIGPVSSATAVVVRPGFIAQINEGPVTAFPLADQAGAVAAGFELALAPESYFDPDTGESLTVVFSGLPAGFAFDPSTGLLSGTASAVGLYQVTVVARDNGEPVLSQTNVFQFLIGKGTPLITWISPSAIGYGTQLGPTQLNASANRPGTLTYNPALQSRLNAGTGQVLSVTFSPVDAANYFTSSTTVALTVNPAPLTVKADDITRVVGKPRPSFSAEITGFVYGETISVLSGTPAFASPGNGSLVAGTFPIIPSLGTLSAGNYGFSQFINGTLTMSTSLPPWALRSGDRVVADRGPYLGTGAILLVSEEGNVQRIISTQLRDPYEIELDGHDTLLVADYQTGRGPQGGGIFRVDLATGTPTAVSLSPEFVTPLGVKIMRVGTNAGMIYVADADAYEETGAVFKVDPQTGETTTLSRGGNFYWLQGLAVTPRGDIFVTDRGDGAGVPAKVIQVNATTGEQTVLSSGIHLVLPVGIVFEPPGSLLVADPEKRAIIRISLATGQQTLASTNSLFTRPTHIALDPHNTEFYVTDGKANAQANEKKLINLNATSGVYSLTSEGGMFDQPRGIVIVP